MIKRYSKDVMTKLKFKRYVNGFEEGFVQNVVQSAKDRVVPDSAVRDITDSYIACVRKANGMQL